MPRLRQSRDSAWIGCTLIGMCVRVNGAGGRKPISGVHARGGALATSTARVVQKAPDSPEVGSPTQIAALGTVGVRRLAGYWYARAWIW